MAARFCRGECEAALKCIRQFEKERDAYAKMLNNGAYYLGHVVAGSGMNRTRLDGDKRRLPVESVSQTASMTRNYYRHIQIASSKSSQRGGTRLQGHRDYIASSLRFGTWEP
jgi:hypothetical protein